MPTGTSTLLAVVGVVDGVDVVLPGADVERDAVVALFAADDDGAGAGVGVDAGAAAATSLRARDRRSSIRSLTSEYSVR
ncbi:MAG TPA: hypothetical protein VFP16_03515, partial [Vicinamibacterales bacterium]|nr:hypothetical protein [Vicinamibacterales bacterium]